jgi:hypothetical protein
MRRILEHLKLLDGVLWFGDPTRRQLKISQRRVMVERAINSSVCSRVPDVQLYSRGKTSGSGISSINTFSPSYLFVRLVA